MVQQQLNWPFQFLKVCNHFQMLKTILCKLTILHIICCGMWHILQETFGARNNCKAVAFDFQIRKTKIKRQRKEEGVGEPWPPLGPRPTSASRTAHSPLLLTAPGLCPAAQPPTLGRLLLLDRPLDRGRHRTGSPASSTRG